MLGKTQLIDSKKSSLARKKTSFAQIVHQTTDSTNSSPSNRQPQQQQEKKEGFLGRLVDMMLGCLQCPEGPARPVKSQQPPPNVPPPKKRSGTGPPVMGPQHVHHVGKKTLVLDLDETLVHSSMSPPAGGRKPDMICTYRTTSSVRKIYVLFRPGVKHFIKKVAEIFEVVIFTASMEEYASCVIDALDPDRVVAHRLYRQACTLSEEGNYIKDLDRINRGLHDTIIVDNADVSYLYHPDNGFLIKTFIDDPKDQELFKLIPHLEYLASLKDVRPVERYKDDFARRSCIFLEEPSIVDEAEEAYLPEVFNSPKVKRKDASIRMTTSTIVPPVRASQLKKGKSDEQVTEFTQVIRRRSSSAGPPRNECLE